MTTKPTSARRATIGVISPPESGWHELLCQRDGVDGVKIELRSLKTGVHLPCPASNMANGVAVTNDEIDASLPENAVFQATMAGWHRVHAAIRPRARGVEITMAWVSAALRAPAEVVEGRHAAGTSHWMTPQMNEGRNEQIEAARDLARYFVVLGGSQGRTSRTLRRLRFGHQERSSEYLELEKLVHENTSVLQTLAERPDRLTWYGWHDVEKLGRQTLRALADMPGGTG